MPGVPSGRACEQCRKQKKKCDETKPTCGRCSRLGILCIGSGERRFKFKSEFAGRELSKSSSASPSKRSPPLEVRGSPSSDFTIFVGSVIDRVHITSQSDLRYNLTWAFGGYLLEVPRRLGANAALDAAADALVTCHLRFNSGVRETSREELIKYTYALGQLRVILDDPTIAASSNTLCAVMLLTLCQYFIGLSGSSFTSHSDGAAQILKARGGRYDEEDNFETMMLLSLRGPILFEGLLHGRHRFSHDEWDHLIMNRLEDMTDVGKGLICLARVPDIAERRRFAVTNGDVNAFSVLRKEAAEIYETAVTILTKFRVLYLDAASKATTTSTSVAKDRSAFIPRDWVLYANFQRIYGLSLFSACFLNCLLRSFSSDEEDVGLQEEVDKFTVEIITLAYDSEVFRPLGSSYMVLCLFIAWISSPDPQTRSHINKLWKIWHTDVPSISSSINQLEHIPMGSTLADVLDGVATKWKALTMEETESDPPPLSPDT
ncbi:hypothetical protein LTR84_000649 [Exophiala bonariae]|uniref:Zn(2)-C6 fungal-type domain-containing protein n=1 Tax=Exophiala bonariae TaxID=1690606 RepID=A0AAV9NV67_9EURO|nr:hypothetical protein LTR84_000649 [Exophiala bonariae]